jgi:hypothetical protein
MPGSRKWSTRKRTGRTKALNSSRKRGSRSGRSGRRGLQGIKGEYWSTKTGRLEKYDSLYELERFKALDASPLVLSWTKKHGIRIKYQLQRQRRTYIPDIVVVYVDGRKFLEEVKGKVWNRLEFLYKNSAALRYCEVKRMKFRILFKEDLAVVS